MPVAGVTAPGPAAVEVAFPGNGADQERQDLFGASATSGAGGTSVGVAGSFGLDLIDSESAATIAANAQVTIASVAGAQTPAEGDGSVTLLSDDLTSSAVLALPAGDGASGGKVGVGASIALNIVATRSHAEAADGSSLSDGGR